MTRPPALTQAEKTKVVLAVLAGDSTLAATAAQHGVSAQAVANWRKAFIAGGAEALSPCNEARRATSLADMRFKQLHREIEDLKIALAEAHLAARVRPHLRVS